MTTHPLSSAERGKLQQGARIPEEDMIPDWGGECEVCGSSPIVPATGMCGPCTFGDSSTVGGNW